MEFWLKKISLCEMFLCVKLPGAVLGLSASVGAPPGQDAGAPMPHSGGRAEAAGGAAPGVAGGGRQGRPAGRGAGGGARHVGCPHGALQTWGKSRH